MLEQEAIEKAVEWAKSFLAQYEHRGYHTEWTLKAKALLQLKEENEKLKQDVAEFEANANCSICAYCGHKAKKEAESIAYHINECVKHPLKKMLDTLQEAGVEMEQLLADLNAAAAKSEKDARTISALEQKLLTAQGENEKLRAVADAALDRVLDSQVGK